MNKLFRVFGLGYAVLAALLVGILTLPAEAARVRGSLKELDVEVTGRLLGFTRTRVAAATPNAQRRKRSVALFLAVKESLPIDTPTEHQIITIEGLQFSPTVATCASDAQVSFVNRDRDPVTLTVGGVELGTIPPDAQKTYPCSPGDATRVVRVVEWPHMRATVYVGEVGVAGTPDDRGRFSIDAPKGSYELRVIGADGVLMTKEVDVDKRDVDLGNLAVAAPSGRPSSE